MGTLGKVDLLAFWVAEALQTSNYEGQDSSRVRELPDVRTIRYYTTLGILDKPAEMRGRTAFYGRRHLLQVVAIKRLQARGLPLTAIQEQLLGVDETKLRDIAALNDKALATILESRPSPPTAKQPTEQPSAARSPKQSFWEASPQWTTSQKQADKADRDPPARPAVLIPVGPGASLLLEGIAPEQISILMQQLAPALEAVRETLSQPGVATDTSSATSDDHPSGDPQEKLA